MSVIENMITLKNSFLEVVSIRCIVILFCFATLSISSCQFGQKNDEVEFGYTGQETKYLLISASEFGVNGAITFKELTNGGVEVLTSLNNTSGMVSHPVHIHEGSMSENGQLLSILNPVQGSRGASTTIVKALMVDETKPFLYSELSNFNASIRVHLNDSDGQNIILAIANIGKNENKLDPDFKVCNDW